MLSTRNSSSVVIHMLGCLRRMLVTACTKGGGSDGQEGLRQDGHVGFQTCMKLHCCMLWWS